jgi:N-hydroxyarylamine O-acetyltransferase
MSLDLDAYFARIGYAGSRVPTLATLHAIAQAHVHDVCEFTLEEMPPIDRELANWYTSMHAQSHFRSRLMAARAAPNGVRLTLLNREFTVRRPGDRSETRLIETPEALLAILAENFGLNFPPGTRFGSPGSPWPA